MDRQPTVKKLKNGKFGLYIGADLLATAKSRLRADIGQLLLQNAFADVGAAAYDDGHIDGYDEGYSDADVDIA